MIVLRSTAELAAKYGIKVLIYGDSGTGKTRACATAPNPVIISAEGGLLSIRSNTLPGIEVTNLVELRNVYEWCLRDRQAYQFSTICLDSISEVAEVCLRAEKFNRRDGRQAYGEMAEKMLQVVRDFRDLPARNVVITAKQEWQKDEATGQMFFGPWLPGRQLGPNLPYMFDEVFQQCVFSNYQTKQRMEGLRCWRDAQNMAKDRSGNLAEWEPPNLIHIFGKIQNGGAYRG